MELLIEIIELATALALLAEVLRRNHTKVEDGDHEEEEEDCQP